ncbi:protein kinase domain-containing protein [Streptomyces sp. CA2R106]|uniref:protein kinase domain-containing protein n=1 Tax=Streptomyces sp. CA2R106 TaxID=3120153 RepID=UPI003008B566
MSDHQGTGKDAGAGIPGEGGGASEQQEQQPARKPEQEPAPKSAQQPSGRPAAKAVRKAPATRPAPKDAAPAEGAADGSGSGETAEGAAPAGAPAGTSARKAARTRAAVPAKKAAAAASTPARKATAAKKAAPAQSAGPRTTSKAAPKTPKTPKIPPTTAPKPAATAAATATNPSGTAKKAPARPAAKSAPDKAVTTPAAPGTATPAEPPAPAWQVPGYTHTSGPAAVPTGQVVRATRDADGTQVAITYLAPELAGDARFRARLRAEAERLATLESPYTVRLLAYVEDGAHAAAVREPVEGVTLAALLDAKGATSPEAALTVLKGALLGLSAAHEAGISGGSACPPANLLVTAEGTPALVDLGGTSSTADIPADLLAATATCHACLPEGKAAEPVQPLLAAGLAAEPAERPRSAIDFAVELEAVAVAAYGAAWEERGRAELAALVGTFAVAPGADAVPAGAAAPVPVPLPAPAPAPGEPARSGVALVPLVTADYTEGAAPGAGAGEEPGRRRRRKGLLLAAAAVIVAGAITVTAVATGGKHGTAAAADPSPSAALTTAASPAATASAASPSPEATTASPTATTPSPSATSAVPAPTTAPATATSAPAATTTPTTIRRTTAPQPHDPAGSAHVTSVAVTDAQCTSDGRTASATVRVRYDGSSGTLRAVWWRSSTPNPQGSVQLVSPQTAQFPKGGRSFTYSGKVSDIAPDRDRPYVGITVSTSPAAASGDNSFAIACR